MATISKDDALRAVDILKSEIDDDKALEHHGIKGMKWGVRNQETLRKYGLIGSAKKKASGLKETLSSKVSGLAGSTKSKAINAAVSKVESAKAKYASKKQQKAELAQQRKELGMKKKEFDKLRETTLKSHDPRVVAKGMHTLSDEELKIKIKRLQEEEKISKMATSREKSRHEIAKARNEALEKNLFVSLGKDAASKFINSSVQELGVNTIIKQGAQPVLEKEVKKYANKAQAQIQKRDEAQVSREMAPYISKAKSIKRQDALDNGASRLLNTKSATTVGQYKPVTKYKPRSEDVALGKEKVKKYAQQNLNNIRFS